MVAWTNYVQNKPVLKTADKKAYMREYMRKRYNESKEECRAYKNSVKRKIAHNLPAEELKVYGKYLADIHRLRKIKQNPQNLIFLVVTAVLLLLSGSFIQVLIQFLRSFGNVSGFLFKERSELQRSFA